MYKLREKDKATFYSLAEEWLFPAASTKEPEERESLWQIQEQVCIWSARKTLSLLSWRPWGYREILRRWWRPTARCKTKKKPRYMSKDWTYSWQLCYLKKLPQCFHSGSSARIIGILTTGLAGKNHISSKWQENWLPYIKLYAIGSPWFIDEFLCNTHTFFFNIFITGLCIWRRQIHRKSSTRKKWKYERGLTGNPVRRSTETENTYKNKGREEVQSDLLHDLADWLQEFRENLVDESSPSEPQETLRLMIFQFYAWITNGVASKSGIGFGQCIYALSEGPKLRYLLEDENNKGFLQKTCWYSRAKSGQFWWFQNCGSQNSQWRKWITQQSSIRCCGTRFGNTVVTILPV